MLTRLRRIAPELLDTVRIRFELMEAVQLMAPVGRRALATHLELPERAVRSEAERLKDLGLVYFAADGIHLTEDGLQLLVDMHDGMDELLTNSVASSLRAAFSETHVIVVPGDSAQDALSMRALYRRASRYLEMVLKDGAILAVMGGSTMSGVAKQLRTSRHLPNALVVPARGGLGEDVEIQANTVAALLAQSLKAKHRLLHWPDYMPTDVLPARADRRFSQWLESICAADVLLFGVGRADTMAQRRGLSPEVLALLKSSGAVAEALGYYFNRSGSVVHVASGLGVDIATLQGIAQRIAVAGGSDKAEAVLAVVRSCEPTALIIDEAVANGMLALLEAGQ